MTNSEIVKCLRSNFFAKKENLGDAFSYLQDIINNLPNGQGAPVMTGVMVVLNTLADEIEKAE